MSRHFTTMQVITYKTMAACTTLELQFYYLIIADPWRLWSQWIKSTSTSIIQNKGNACLVMKNPRLGDKLLLKQGKCHDMGPRPLIALGSGSLVWAWMPLSVLGFANVLNHIYRGCCGDILWQHRPTHTGLSMTDPVITLSTQTSSRMNPIVHWESRWTLVNHIIARIIHG